MSPDAESEPEREIFIFDGEITRPSEVRAALAQLKRRRDELKRQDLVAEREMAKVLAIAEKLGRAKRLPFTESADLAGLSRQGAYNLIKKYGSGT